MVPFNGSKTPLILISDKLVEFLTLGMICSFTTFPKPFGMDDDRGEKESQFHTGKVLKAQDAAVTNSQ